MKVYFGAMVVGWVFLSLVTLPTTANIVTTFSDDTGAPDFKFNHLVVDKNTGRVFIGAVNRLYQLSPDLEVVVTETTGPQEDSPDCSVIDCPTSAVEKLTDNVNKALVIDYTTSRLIVCGSQGICSVRNINNISDVTQVVKEAVAADNAVASTVAFIAPGPPNPPVTQVMYVGVTYTNNSPYHREVPTVSSRSLDKDKMFMIAQSAVTTGSRMFVKSFARKRYPINFVYGFAWDGFSYFLTTQMKHFNPSPYISKLVRVCHDDENYYSYTEIPIECIDSEGKRYNLVQAGYVGRPGSDLAANLGITAQDDVLFAVFSESEQPEGEGSSKPSQSSALCVYSLKAIRRKFMQNIKTCFNGSGNTGLDFITPSRPCTPAKLQILGEDFCGLDINTPLGGKTPMTAVPVLLVDQHLTAVAATSTGDYTVVFLGTSKGRLKKVVVGNSTSASEYGNDLVKEDSPVNADLHFDSQVKHLYVMTEKQVAKVKVADCSVYKTCSDCLGSKDPYCGWCSLENKCSLKSDCEDAGRDVLFWISYKIGKCTTITSVQRTTERTLDVVIENLPSLNGQLLCAFTVLNKTLITKATRKSNGASGVNCTTPSKHLLPSIPFGQHHFTAKLSVRMNSGPDFVETNITFFDCTTYDSCTQCVSSAFPCNWCINGRRCTQDDLGNCPNDNIITGVSRTAPSFRSGPAFCRTS